MNKGGREVKLGAAGTRSVAELRGKGKSSIALHSHPTPPLLGLLARCCLSVFLALWQRIANFVNAIYSEAPSPDLVIGF